MYTQEQLEPYYREIAETDFGNIVGYLKKLRGKEILQPLLKYVCDELLNVIQRAYYRYYGNVIEKDPIIKVYLETTSFIESEDMAYYLALAEYFKGNVDNVMKYIRLADKNGFFGNEREPITEIEFINCFIAPFKGGYDGFWDDVYELLAKNNTEKCLLELCRATKIFYTSADNNEIRQTLESVIQLNPSCKAAKMMLALNYYFDRMWGNSVALFEQLEDGCCILLEEDFHFYMAWCYGKLKETSNEIIQYEKCAEIAPDGNSVMNNLGYAYYKAKQYEKALECFKMCLDNNWDTKYAANNYVRTLLSVKRFRDAKEFVKSSSVRIYKDLLERVNKAENTNERTKSDELLVAIPEHHTADAAAEKVIDIGVKKQQFTSEKILEDEIVHRMDLGLETFGKRLKVYRRKGVYGRQYILSNGKRLDILAEDEEGNLYVIELKKDSGYDDAYRQTVEYLEWFDDNWQDKGVNVSGIICLNDPSDELLEKVHGDPRVKVFEYTILYNER